MDVATFERGLKLDDRVELLEAIGQGAMGAVYKATQRGVDRPVAVKVMHITALKDPESVKRFFREAQVISALDHPNIVKVYAVNTSGEGRPYMVMDYIKGVTLYDLIHQKKLTAESYLDIFTQVCQALEHAHEKDIVHRDIKPRNILLEETADGKYVVKLVDFGIARLTQPDTVPGQKITKTGAIIGSPSYMSPEQCTGRAVDSRTDIYSLGCVMYEAATGEVPFKDEDAVGLIGKHVMESAPPVEGRSQVRGLPKAIGKVIALMMEKAPEDRYQDAQTLHKDLVAIKNNEKPPFAARTTTHTLLSAPRRKRRKTLALCVVASALGVVAFFAVQAMGHKFAFLAPTAPPSATKEITDLCSEGARLTARKRWAEAQGVYGTAYDLCVANKIESKLYADVCYGRARCAAETGNYNAAHRYFMIAANWYNTFDMNNKHMLAMIVREWGRSNLKDNSYVTASNLLERAYREYKKMPPAEFDAAGRVLLLQDMVEAFRMAKKPFSAASYYPELLEAQKKVNFVSVMEQALTRQQYADELAKIDRKDEAAEQRKIAAELNKAAEQNLQSAP